MTRARKAARPHQVAAAPILEDAEFRLQHQAIRRRQLQPDRLRAKQLHVDLDGHWGNLRREVLDGDRCRLGRLRNQRQQALTLKRRSEQEERRGGRNSTNPASAVPQSGQD